VSRTRFLVRTAVPPDLVIVQMLRLQKMFRANNPQAGGEIEGLDDARVGDNFNCVPSSTELLPLNDPSFRWGDYGQAFCS